MIVAAVGIIVAIAAALVAIVAVGAVGGKKSAPGPPARPSGVGAGSSRTSRPALPPPVTSGEISAVLDRYRRAYSDEDVAGLRALFADKLVRRSGADPPEDLTQALATYAKQFSEETNPHYTISHLNIRPGRGEGWASGVYTIVNDQATNRGAIRYHFVNQDGRVLIDRITIRRL